MTKTPWHTMTEMHMLPGSTMTETPWSTMTGTRMPVTEASRDILTEIRIEDALGTIRVISTITGNDTSNQYHDRIDISLNMFGIFKGVASSTSTDVFT
ncbi:hypothetical protein TanjilG_31200 [Lupinus angustifolius]|uniref:Uncharacterized protein n=1 Tax=Lupinus angustifolius TaxID=3871 RepID=A0A1J7HG44_LUPAN|nr:hypothetical protein TanjilG_31200 [Lupinus angustifolius]